eukprot:CAMPEP_0180834906 /NCGR_PEP_ID=MMETSP1038_2-20121128/78099_1 /TAXON_ID=632150 /ORGANISM="Azadinium spinosum, Strain 3D9" /LENGTH=170 /DNA_ID=CAMNT_0022878157 /DNA_START=519 /DNA_END=1031 /DNA_ORIENTATION=-
MTAQLAHAARPATPPGALAQYRGPGGEILSWQHLKRGGADLLGGAAEARALLSLEARIQMLLFKGAIDHSGAAHADLSNCPLQVYGVGAPSNGHWRLRLYVGPTDMSAGGGKPMAGCGGGAAESLVSLVATPLTPDMLKAAGGGAAPEWRHPTLAVIPAAPVMAVAAELG